MMRKVLFLTALLSGLLMLSPVFAADSTGSVTPPDKVVEQTATDVLSAIRENKDKFLGHPDAVYQLVEQEMAPHFDFDYAARLVLGRSWRDATPEQRQAFVKAFEHYLVNSYANELVKHANAKVKVEPFRGSPSDERADIGSTIVPEDGKPLQVHYAMHRTDDGWKAFDVRAEGVSYVMSYRNTFASEIRQTSLDALIERLQDKAKQKAQEASKGGGDASGGKSD
ncbi:MAG TPA: ABC transporter substrate-binding protein [Gammaproteobacteria bacterium]|nr:ABC transporter substrate-binding protein [Gammaproteobacteria bacterium]